MIYLNSYGVGVNPAAIQADIQIPNPALQVIAAAVNIIQ